MKHRLIVGIGDIHGRFHRVAEWLERLQEGRAQAIDLAFAVGDVEAFPNPVDRHRKAVKRAMPAEFAEYASGARQFACPLYFIGGNNEDFSALAPMPEGGSLAPGMHYLGRAGVRTLAGLRIAFLSGIYAPKWYEEPVMPPGTTVVSWKQAGYFRRADLATLEDAQSPDLLILHEWPRGLAARGYMGNPIARDLVAALQPAWVWLGHSHRGFGARRIRALGGVTRFACLDQASEPDRALVWLEWDGSEVVRGGWGCSGTPAGEEFPELPESS